MSLRFVIAFAVIALCNIGCQTMKEMTGVAPSLRGNYVLDYRELPDGKHVRPPEVCGMLTFTKDHRNFNVTWMDGGKQYSVSTISRYWFDGKTYTEESLFYQENMPGGMKYGAVGEKASSPVTHNDGKWQFKLPLHNEPDAVFTGNAFTATRAGAFVDHWTKKN